MREPLLVIVERLNAIRTTHEVWATPVETEVVSIISELRALAMLKIDSESQAEPMMIERLLRDIMDHVESAIESDSMTRLQRTRSQLAHLKKHGLPANVSTCLLCWDGDPKGREPKHG